MPFVIRHSPMHTSRFTLAAMSRDRTTIIRTPPCAPVAHPYAERSVGTVRRELCDRTVIWNTRQLAHLLNEYGEHYNTQRPTVARPTRTKR